MTVRPEPPNVPSQADVGMAAITRMLGSLQRKVKDLERAGRLGSASVEDSTVDVYDDDDELQVSVGRKAKGKHGAGYVGTAQPPSPTEPDCIPIPGGMIVFWDGQLEEATDVPVDRVEVYASNDSGFTITEDLEVAACIWPGGGACVIPTWGEDRTYVRLVAVSENEVYSDPTGQVDGLEVQTEIGFYVDEFTLETAGAQDLTLTFEPIAFSEHVYWHAGGPTGAGLHMQDDVTWTREGVVLSLTGEPVEAKVGDVIVCKYAYLIEDGATERITAQIVSSDHSDSWTVEFVWFDENGDEKVVELAGVNDPGPWPRQEVGHLNLADITVRLTTPSGTFTYPGGHFDRTTIEGTDALGTFHGHEYSLEDTGWHDDLKEASEADPYVVVVSPEGFNRAAENFDPDNYDAYVQSIRFFDNTWSIRQAFTGPAPNAIPDAITCGWGHALAGHDGSNTYWNNPPNGDITWNGSGACGPYTSGIKSAGSGVGGSRIAWNAVHGGSSTGDFQAKFLSTGLYVLRDDLLALTPGPAAGFTPPSPPPGMTVQWEFEEASLDVMQVAIDEPVANVGNTGEVRWKKMVEGGYGRDATGNHTGTAPVGAVLHDDPYSGGLGAWTPIDPATDLNAGATYLVGVSEYMHSGVQPPGSGSETRNGTLPIFRMQFTARRYRFVPDEPDTLVFDLKSYTNPDDLED